MQNVLDSLFLYNHSLLTDQGEDVDTKDITGAIANPIYLSTAYQHPHLGQSTGYDYTRTPYKSKATNISSPG
jgi:cystathionine beta-lyase/cystathionine gamma-synthase